MANDDAERSEAPTTKRIEEARRRGEVAQSRDLTSVLVLGTALLLLGGSGVDALLRSIVAQARSAWSGALLRPEGVGDFQALLLHHGIATAGPLLGIVLALLAAGVIGHIAQSGPLWSPEALRFRGTRLDPIGGLRRLFAADRLFDLAKAPLKIGVVAIAFWVVLAPSFHALWGLAGASPAAALRATRELGVGAGRGAVAGLAALAVLDLLWVRRRLQKRLRMTPREVRDELREREGSPQVRGRRRQLQRELSRQRMIAEVARADVVVTNPVHYAVAMRYERARMAAPRVVARGRNHLAVRIRRVAREAGVPIVENPPLARLLYRATRVGSEIPETLFQAVAEVLAQVHRLDRRRAAAWRAAP